jgi:hypothetical protein
MEAAKGEASGAIAKSSSIDAPISAWDSTLLVWLSRSNEAASPETGAPAP